MAMLLRAVPLGSPGLALPAGVCTAAELERAAAFLDPVRRHEFLAGRLALRGLVAEAVRADPCAVVPAYRCPECGEGEHGAPGFALVHDGGGRLPLRVAASMSRAGGWTLLAAEATSSGREVGAPHVGVDLTAVADFRRAIPDAAFSEAERRRVYGSGDPAAEAARLWARKEALLKAAGTGLRGDLAGVETLGDLRVRDLEPREFGLPAGFAAAVAAL